MREWPPREEWARRRQTLYAGMENPRPATKRLSAYAAADEIAEAIAAVKALRLEVHRAEWAAHRALGPLGRQRGETARTYDRRVLDMTREDCDAVISAMPSGPQPYELNETLQELQAGWVPWRWRWEAAPPPSPLDEIIARYKAAAKQADDDWRAEVEGSADRRRGLGAGLGVVPAPGR